MIEIGDQGNTEDNKFVVQQVVKPELSLLAMFGCEAFLWRYFGLKIAV